MNRTATAAVLAGALAVGGLTWAATASATEEKVTICHAAGQDGTTKFVELTLSREAVYKEQGGHFEEDGTPQAGHELDYFGPCEPGTTTVPTTKPPGSTTSTPAPTTTLPPTTDTTLPTTTTAPPELIPPKAIERGPEPVPADPDFAG